MTVQLALPGLALGTLGLAAGVGAVATGSVALGAAGGVLALAAGAASLPLARRLRDHQAAQTLLLAELKEARATRETGSAPATAADPDRETEAEVMAPEPSPTSAEGAPRPSEPTEDTIRVDDGVEVVASPMISDDGESTLVDPSTGLFSETFFTVALDSRITAARRHLRPVSLILLDVVTGPPDGDPSAVDPVLVAAALKATLREADTASRLDNGCFGILLEDTPENGAIWTVERIRRHLAEEHTGQTVWAGVSCYPAHAFGAEKMVEAAEAALVVAKEWPQDRIEVAAATD